MPNRELPIVNPLQLWSSIQAGAMQSLDTFSLQQSINATMETLGVRYGPETLGQVAKLRSAAVRERLAIQSLGAAKDTDSITAGMVAQMPYGRVAEGDFGRPTYGASVRVTMLEDGQLVPRTVVIDDIDPGAMTVGELRDMVDEYVADAADHYSGGLASVDSISIQAT